MLFSGNSNKSNSITLQGLLDTYNKICGNGPAIITKWKMHPDTLRRFEGIIFRCPGVIKEMNPSGFMTVAGIELSGDDTIPVHELHEYAGKQLVRVKDLRKNIDFF